MPMNTAIPSNARRIYMKGRAWETGSKVVARATRGKAGQYLYPMVERLRTGVLVVGSGVAGLHSAWRASEKGEVLLLTKKSLFDSATSYAQGGIAAALGAGDSPEL